MKKSQMAVVRLLCIMVIAVACTGLLVTGAFAYNTAITRTPVETLTYGTFSAALDGDGLQPADDGSYTLAPREAPYTLTLRTSGNVARWCLLEITAEEPGQQLQFCTEPDTPETTFAVDTDYTLTLRLTVQETAPESTAALTADTAVEFRRPPEPVEEPAASETPAPAAEQTAQPELTPEETPAAAVNEEPAAAEPEESPVPAQNAEPEQTSAPNAEPAPEEPEPAAQEAEPEAMEEESAPAAADNDETADSAQAE